MVIAEDDAEDPEGGGTGSGPGDATAVAAALAVWVGAAGPLRPTGLVVAGVLVVLALLARSGARRLALLVGLVLISGFCAGRSEAGLVPPEAGPFSGEVRLVGDPELRPGQARVEVSASGRRYELVATGGGVGTLGRASSGDHLVVTAGRIGPPRGAQGYLRARHISGRIQADALEPGPPPAPLWALANSVRARVARGAEVLPPENAALVVGLVFGDDRGLPPAAEHDLRASGLAHLTAVSGQNVAFLLVIASPLLARLELGGRLVAVALILGFFLVMTRVEPSVLRAAAMAGAATAGTTFGRPVRGVRLVATAVVVLVLVDPMLVHSLGFVLSVAATTGIVVGAGGIAAALPGPRWLSLPVAVTVSAQLAVAPVLVALGLGLPVVAVLANPIAGPAAGWTMAWGLTAGWVAGWLPSWAATIVHLPTHLFTGIVLFAARAGGSLPVGSVGAGHLVAIGCAIAALAVAARSPRPLRSWVRMPALALLSGAVLLAAIPDPPGDGRTLLAGGAELIVAGERRALVVDGRADPLRVLDALDAADVSSLDVVVVRSAGPRVAATVRVVTSRVPSGRVLVPVGAVARGQPVDTTEVLAWSTGDVVVRAVRGGLSVEGGDLR